MISVERQYQNEIDYLTKRLKDLRFGIERIIEKTKYDEYGSFEDVRIRIIALATEVLAKDDLA